MTRTCENKDSTCSFLPLDNKYKFLIINTIALIGAANKRNSNPPLGTQGPPGEE